MKRMFLAGVSALAVVTAVSTANAADLARRQMPVKAPVYTAPGFNWTGFYVGINGGGAFGHSNWTNPLASTGDFNVSGGMVGGIWLTHLLADLGDGLHQGGDEIAVAL